MNDSVDTSNGNQDEKLTGGSRRIKVQRGQPQELERGDRIGGYLNFMSYVEGDGYHFYQTCGLQECVLHWQTVNWLLEYHDVTRATSPTPSKPPVETTKEVD